MLPSGHIAAGYLAATGTAALLNSQFPELENNTLIAFGTFMAFAPDLDMFYKFSQIRKFYFTSNTDTVENTHRTFITHIPLFYLAVSLVGFFVGLSLNSGILPAAAIMFFVGSWSHFILDSSGYGIKWLWPFKNKLYSVAPIPEPRVKDNTGFLNSWLMFLKRYLYRPEFYIEILIILIAIIIFTIQYS